MNKEKFSEQTNTIDKTKTDKTLVLYNDDYHTFDYVIDALINICKHNETQAVQCTYLVHYKGKSEIKKGYFDTLKPMKDKLRLKGLDAKIE